MRSVLLLAVLATPVLAGGASPFTKLRGSRSWDGIQAALRPADCALHVESGDLELMIPLRSVTWTLSTVPGEYGSKAPVAIATCAKKAQCMSGSAESHTTGIPHRFWREQFTLDHFQFHLAAKNMAEARTLVTQLGAFAQTNCTSPAATGPASP